VDWNGTAKTSLVGDLSAKLVPARRSELYVFYAQTLSVGGETAVSDSFRAVAR
jgi:hypothetical protein